IKVWNLQAALGQGMHWHTTNSIDTFAISRDERLIAIKDTLGRVNVSDLATGRGIRSVEVGEPNSTATGFAISFSPTSHLLAWTGLNSVGVLDSDSGKTTRLPLSRSLWCNPAFSPDGREFAFAGITNIMMWELATGRTRSFAPTEDLVCGLAFSPNG